MFGSGYYLQIFLAMKITIFLSLIALVIGLFLGLIGSIVEKLIFPFNWIAKVGHLIIRALPEIIVIFIFYFGLSQLIEILFSVQVNINAFVSGALALSIIFGAYASQILIAARNSIDIGQVDSAKALGMGKLQIYLYIILPELFRHAFPGLMNLWLVVLKDSSIVSIIGITDIMRAAQTAASQTYAPLVFYGFAAMLYLLLCSGSLIVGNKIDRVFNKGSENAPICL